MRLMAVVIGEQDGRTGDSADHQIYREMRSHGVVTPEAAFQSEVLVYGRSSDEDPVQRNGGQCRTA